ncbi:MarR family protein [Jatrophihabitans endophyticus]|uniref:MarR family protein n=1 Tax=Jatrophihabitans endophyticus TaxID=1206085 RepID=A0A1M5L1Y2_9ACTN|nr:MarR family transcriptional regulator [Jatrophihabitans endophyticus]SHG59037.1 MarR family protein [Jatrophihabitans endophyticus]
MTFDPAGDAALGDLADLILDVGRLIRSRTPTGQGLVALTDTERTVMRVVDLYPGCAPSDIARRARLQRTNVSTALRSLEDKGMVARDHTGRRGVAVTPTPRARGNLQTLRTLWAAELAAALGADRTGVAGCAAVLTRLERRLIDDD